MKRIIEIYIHLSFFACIILSIITLVFKQLIHIGLIHQSSIYYLEIDPTVVGKDFKRPFDSATYSSGRVEDWKNILIQLKSSIIFGYGAQGDRFLINQTASNGLIYAISSSGIFGYYTLYIFFNLIFMDYIQKFFNKF